MTALEDYQRRTIPRRQITGIAAALLPFDETGNIAVDAYSNLLFSTHAAGLMNAVNMDTGYINYLSADEKEFVLKTARETLGAGVPFVAGAYIEGIDGEPAHLYRKEIEQILHYGGTPILFQTSRLHGKSSAEIVKVYSEAVQDTNEALVFELGAMFAPNGTIFDDATIQGLMEIPEITGIKHSSLSIALELRRLELRDRIRPDFKIYTGNDLGIRMVEFGSDYLLGLAAFAPEKFAERDRAWLTGDPAYYELSEALQYLGSVAFRAPVPAYKHSAAIFLNLLGKIPTSRTHPNSPMRPAWERDILMDCARRLNLEGVGSRE